MEVDPLLRIRDQDSLHETVGMIGQAGRKAIAIALDVRETASLHEAIATADSYLKTEPKSWYVRKILSVCYALNDRCSEAISETEKILAGVPSVESDADTLYQMAFNYAHCGEIGKAKALLEAFNKTSVASEDPAGVAWIYAALGEKLGASWLTFDAEAHERIAAEKLSFDLNAGLPEGWSEASAR